MKTCVDLVTLNDIVRHAGDDTIIKVADKLNLDRNTVASVLKGTNKPSSTFMYRFVEVYSVSPDAAGNLFFAHNLRNK